MADKDKKKDAHDLGSLVLPKDDDLKERIEAAQDRIKEKEWKRACETLQALVGRTEDVFVPVTRKAADGTETTAYVSVKKEAARLISTMPRDGRDQYQVLFGDKAKKDVEQARTNNDFRRMAQTLSLYLYTEHGPEAANWLGTYMLDRAEFQGAARFFSILVERVGLKDLKDRTLIKAAYTFHQAGDKDSKEKVFKELDRRNIEVKLRDEMRTVADLQDSINKIATVASLQSASDSPIYRGRPDRSAMLAGGTAFLEASWKQKMSRTEATSQLISNAENAMRSRNFPILNSFVPVTATMAKGEKKIPLLIYRSYWGVHVVNMQTGKLVWDSKSDLSFDAVMGAAGPERATKAGVINAYSQWSSHFLQSSVRPQMAFENSVLSTVSTDNKNVYAVEDLPIPPPQHMTAGNINPGIGTAYNWGKEVADAISHNKLVAFDLARDGKLAWEIGGREGNGPLTDSYFLSAPVPINGRLYVLNEKQQELRIATIDPANGKLLALQALASTKDLKLSQDPLRRTQACHPSYGEGILVVPTNAGAVFGVDLLSNSLLWAYPYRTKQEPQTPPGWNPRFGGVPPAGWIRLPTGQVVRAGTTETHWQVTAPVVQDGKVVFTAPDETEVHCVNLRDGSRVWTHTRRPDDLYLGGVYNGKVILVGKTRTRALSLNRGEIVWDLETGLPSGQGAASAPNSTTGDIIYYLPIREAVNSREPEICAINIDKGIIHAHTRSRKKEVPGNLTFYDGAVLSQTHSEVVAYPQLEVQLARLNKKVEEDPDNPALLTERGDYLLDKGDLGGAIADFRKALRNKPDDNVRNKARAKLYDAFTEYFQRDFAKAEEFIKEYEEMCRIDLTNLTGPDRTAAELEMRRRRSNFLCLVGKGREAQNRLVEAFERYLELGAEAKKDEMIQVVDEPSLKSSPDVWSQGRIASMIAKATDAKQKKAVEDQITKRWDAIKNTRPLPLEDLRKFVKMFGSLFDVGKEARFALADRLMDDTDINSLLEAEQQLSLLRGDDKPEIAARAVEALARLNESKGRLPDAAHYYRLLGEKYPKVTVDGKTGQEYLDDLATDKRFLPYLDGSGRFTIKGKVDLRHKEDRRYHSVTTPYYQFKHEGEALPFFNTHKLSLEMNWNHQLRLYDVSTGEERWKIRLTQTQFQQIAQANGQGHKVDFSYQSLGHLVVLQLGHMVFGIDPLGKGRILWERNLSSLPGGAMYYNSLTLDPKDNAVVLTYSDGWMQRLGNSNGALQGGVVCVLMRDSLTAIDPVSGRTLWTRTDINSRTQIFGDEQHLYLVSLGESYQASGTRVLRAYDGVSVRVRDFSREFNNRRRISGRTILASDTDAKGQLSLRMYDVLEGKDVWSQKFEANTVLLNSENERLVGVIEPGALVRVWDVPTRKEILNAKLTDPAHVAGALGISLLADPDYLFLAVNGPADANVPAWSGGVQSNVKPDSGLRTVPVNGAVYAFNRQTGKIQWFTQVENQHLILSQVEDLPMLLFTSRYQHMGPPPNRMNLQKFAVRAVAKHNGKTWYASRLVDTYVDTKETAPIDASNFNTGFFHTLTMDHRTGKVEFTAEQTKITLTADPK